jgi:transketolase
VGSQDDERELQRIATKLRRRIIELMYEAQTGHPGGSLGIAELMACLYFRELRIDPARPEWEDRDRFVLSKGHAAPIYYATLMERGYFSDEVLSTYGDIDSCLQGHPDMLTPGVDMSSGSLGQGLSPGTGMALGARLKGKDLRVYVLLGDGEIQSGQVWEAAMAAAKFRLDNLVAIVDENRLQVVGFVDSVMPLAPIADKWRAFGWHTLEIDGHNVGEILGAFDAARSEKGRPTVIIARTVKGKGVSFMENAPEWHSKPLTEADRAQALADLTANGVV